MAAKNTNRIKNVFSRESWHKMIPVLLLVFCVPMVVTSYKIAEYGSTIESQIHEAEKEIHAQGVALEHLVRAMGYGGFIHQFKNLILRHDPNIATPINLRLQEVETALNTLGAMPLSKQDLIAVAVIKETVADYKNSFATALQMIEQNHEIATIDKAVKVNDEPAFAALSFLEESWQEARTREMEVYKNTKAAATAVYWSQIFVIACFLVLVFISYRQAKEKGLQLAEVVDGAAEGIISIDSKGNITSFNNAAERIFEFSAKEVISNNIKLLMPENVAKHHDSYIKNYMSGALPKVIGIGREVTGRRKDGTHFPMNLSVSSSGGKKKFFTGIVRDITEEKKALQELKLSNRIINESPDLIATIDANYRITQANTAFAKAFASNETTLVGTNFLTTVGSKFDQDLVRQEADRCFSGEIVHVTKRYYHQKNKQEHLALQYLPMVDSGNKVYQIIFLAQNVTELKNGEESLRKLVKRLDLATRSGGIGIWEWDIVNNKLDWDDRMYEIYGVARSKNDESYEFWEKAVLEEDLPQLKEDIDKALEGIADFNSSFRIRRPDNTTRHIATKGIIQRNQKGAALVMFGVNIDVTEQEEQQLELVHARELAEQANKAKSDFLSSMSHELRTPLNSIIGFAQLLETDTESPLDDNQRESLKYILKGGKHLLSLIDEILDLAKIEAGKLTLAVEPVDIHRLIDECLSYSKVLAEKNDISIEANIDEALPAINCDRLRMKQCILNLASNAIKYNNPNGKVRLSCHSLDADRVRVAISDTGIGIPQGKQTELFSPFNRVGAENSGIEGTGIGLALTKKLVEEMGSRIGMESQPDIGSIFWIDMPVSKSPAMEEPDAQKKILKNLNIGKTQRLLLYIEDNPSNLALMTAIVDKLKEITLISAHTAELGIALAEKYNPDLIVLDINLPGIDGNMALNILKSNPQTRHIPVVALSADAMPESIKRGLKSGFQEYLTKPLNIAKFIDVLRQLFDGPQHGISQSH